jgi:hypothetical protein
VNHMSVCKLISRAGYTFYIEARPPTGGGGRGNFVFLFFCFFCSVHCSDESPKYFIFFDNIPVTVDFCGSIMFILSQIEKKTLLFVSLRYRKRSPDRSFVTPSF